VDPTNGLLLSTPLPDSATAEFDVFIEATEALVSKLANKCCRLRTRRRAAALPGGGCKGDAAAAMADPLLVRRLFRQAAAAP